MKWYVNELQSLSVRVLTFTVELQALHTHPPTPTHTGRAALTIVYLATPSPVLLSGGEVANLNVTSYFSVSFCFSLTAYCLSHCPALSLSRCLSLSLSLSLTTVLCLCLSPSPSALTTLLSLSLPCSLSVSLPLHLLSLTSDRCLPPLCCSPLPVPSSASFLSLLSSCHGPRQMI